MVELGIKVKCRFLNYKEHMSVDTKEDLEKVRNKFQKMTIQIFDFDGVICDSNSIKTSCLKKAVKNINSKAADEFEKHHKKNGGISRYFKFKRITEKYNCDKKIMK